MTQGLLLIDIQNDYFPSGKMELEGSHPAGRNAARLLDFFRDKGWPLFHIQHIATRTGATFFLPDTPGAEIFIDVQPRKGEIVLQKHFPNSFRETGLQAALQTGGIETLIVAGMMTHMCVDTTVRAASDLGYSCLIAHDACATRPLKFGERTVAAADVQTAYMAALQGSFGKVLSTAEILEELTPKG